MRLAKLKEIREKKRVTQEELSQITGISEEKIKRIEEGTAKIYPKTAEKLASALGVEINDLSGKKFQKIKCKKKANTIKKLREMISS